MSDEHHVLKDLHFYEVIRAIDAKALQDRLDQREKKCQEGTLKQAPGGSRLVASSNARPSAKEKKKKLDAQATRRVPAPTPTSLSASTSISSSAVGTGQDSTIDSSFVRAEPKREVEPIVPRIIYEPKGEEDIVANLRSGFKERQRKRLFESIAVSPSTVKGSCMEEPRVAPISDTPLAPMPFTNAAEPSSTSNARPFARKNAHHKQVGPSIGLTSTSEGLNEKEVSTHSHPPTPHAPSWEEEETIEAKCKNTE